MFTWPWKMYRTRIKELEKLVEEERSARRAEHCLHVDAPKDKGSVLMYADGGIGWGVIGPDDVLMKRMKQVELRLGRDMQGHWFTKPITDATDPFVSFVAEDFYPNGEGGPTYAGRLTTATSRGFEVAERARLTVSELLDWHMVPVEREGALKADMKRRAQLLAMTPEERDAEQLTMTERAKRASHRKH